MMRLRHRPPAASACWELTRPGTGGWRACRSATSVGSRWSPAPWQRERRLEVHPGFGAAAVAGRGRPSVLVSLVPTALGRVSAESFHTVVLGGSAPPSGLASNVVTTYGMTETGSGVVYDGLPLDGVEVAIATEGGGAAGEVRLRGPMLLRAYRDGTVPYDADGWFATGDAGAIGPEGRLVILGRLSDLIISGGENVWPAAVESVLRHHPAVADVAVAGRPDPRVGRARRRVGRSDRRRRSPDPRRPPEAGQGAPRPLGRPPPAGRRQFASEDCAGQGAPDRPRLGQPDRRTPGRRRPR